MGTIYKGKQCCEYDVWAANGIVQTLKIEFWILKIQFIFFFFLISRFNLSFFTISCTSLLSCTHVRILCMMLLICFVEVVMSGASSILILTPCLFLLGKFWPTDAFNIPFDILSRMVHLYFKLKEPCTR